MYYQPKVHAGSNKVMGVEALIRWHHPERGLVMPYEFIQKIEATDLIHLNETLAQFAEGPRVFFVKE